MKCSLEVQLGDLDALAGADVSDLLAQRLPELRRHDNKPQPHLGPDLLDGSSVFQSLLSAPCDRGGTELFKNRFYRKSKSTA